MLSVFFPSVLSFCVLANHFHSLCIEIMELEVGELERSESWGESERGRKKKNTIFFLLIPPRQQEEPTSAFYRCFPFFSSELSSSLSFSVEALLSE